MTLDSGSQTVTNQGEHTCEKNCDNKSCSKNARPEITREKNGDILELPLAIAPASSEQEKSRQELLSAYSTMLLARRTDEKSIVLYKQNKAHFQIGCAGHEAIQVAAARAFRPGQDWAYPYYREMAFVLAWGMTPRELLLGILNKADDPNSGGRQMPMHYGHQGLNIVNQSSPTGTQYLQAVGAAHAEKFRGSDNVVYVSSGEGTCAQGDYHEALNWAARDKLPVIFVIQDNQYAISVHVSEQHAGGSVAQISSGYQGLEVCQVDGLDYRASAETMQRAVQRARTGGGPSVVVANVVRLQSHSISDNQAKYRSAEEIAAEATQDPLLLLAAKLVSNGIASAEELKQIDSDIRKQINLDADWAELQPDPTPASFANHVYSGRYPQPEIEESAPEGEDLFLVDAVNRALDEEMTRNPEMVIFGQDVAKGKGGVFTVTAGLTKKHGEQRCFNSPLAESSIIGTAIGMSTVGLKPVVEIQFGDYIWTAMMQLRNELALMNYRSNGTFTCPAVVRVAVGGYIQGALYHSQNIEATFSHFPGLLVVLPSNAADAKGLLKSAIRANDPVLFLEHKGLYRQVFAKGKVGGAEDLIPIGKARIARTGNAATIVTYGALVHRSLVAAAELAKEGVETEVIDLRTLLPLDTTTIATSVRKTGRLLIAYEDVLFMGYGAEVAAFAAEHLFEYLDAPVLRIGGAFTPIPHAPVLEKKVLPQTDNIVAGLRKLLEY